MTFAKLLLEIRRRAAVLSGQMQRSVALEQATREILERASSPQDPALRILGALVGLDKEDQFDATVLDALTPEAILGIDLIAEEILNRGREKDVRDALKKALLNALH